MEQARELLDKYYSNTGIFYDSSEIETKIIQISFELTQSFSIKQKMLFDNLNVLLENKKTIDDLHSTDFIISNILKK